MLQEAVGTSDASVYKWVRPPQWCTITILRDSVRLVVTTRTLNQLLLETDRHKGKWAYLGLTFTEPDDRHK